jgi:magnesium-transporting ATPase (P-type)
MDKSTLDIAFESTRKCKAVAMFMHDMSPASSTIVFCFLMVAIPSLCYIMGGSTILPASDTMSPSTNDSSAKPASSSPKEAFVVGSVVFTCICAMLFILALCIQRFAYCPQYNAHLWVTTWMFWFLFAGQVLGVCYAAGCWLVLLRDLWGQRGRELVPIQEITVVVAVLAVIFAPFVMVWLGVAACVRWLQKERQIESETSHSIHG